MKPKDLIRLGVLLGGPIQLAHEFIRNFIAFGNDRAQIKAEIVNIVANPSAFLTDELRAPLARAIYGPRFTPRSELAPWHQWGKGPETQAVKQMANVGILSRWGYRFWHLSCPIQKQRQRVEKSMGASDWDERCLSSEATLER